MYIFLILIVISPHIHLPPGYTNVPYIYVNVPPIYTNVPPIDMSDYIDLIDFLVMGWAD